MSNIKAFSLGADDAPFAEHSKWKQLMQQKQVPEHSEIQITGVNTLLPTDNWSILIFSTAIMSFLPWSRIQLFEATRAKQNLSCLWDFDTIWWLSGTEILRKEKHRCPFLRTAVWLCGAHHCDAEFILTGTSNNLVAVVVTEQNFLPLARTTQHHHKFKKEEITFLQN